MRPHTLPGVLAGVLSGLWAGMLATVGFIAAPAAFAVLARPEAGRYVARVFEMEAATSLSVAIVLFLLERRRTREGGSAISANLLLVLGALFCTVAGYYALQPMMEAAREGKGALSFGALHAISLGLFALKGVLVLVLAWRTVRSSPTS